MEQLFEYVTDHLFGSDTVSTNDDISIPDDHLDPDDLENWDDEDIAIFRYIYDTTRLSSVLEARTIQELAAFFIPENPTTSLIMGYVQSGKSEIMFAVALFVARLLGVNVVVVLRNYVSDHQQFDYNFRNVFLEDLRGHLRGLGYDILDQILPVLSAGSLSRSREHHRLNDPDGVETAMSTGNGAVVIALANEPQLGALVEILDRADEPRPYLMMVDEVDDTAYGSGQGHDFLRALMDRSVHTIGVSATVFDPLHDQRFFASRVRILPPPVDYKGIQDFRKCVIQPLLADPTISRLERDPDLIRVLDDLRSTILHTSETSHPIMILLKNERLKRKQNDMMNDLIDRYQEDYTILVHNSDASTVYAPGSRLRAIGALGRRLRPDTRRHGVYYLRRTAIQDILQLLKSQPRSASRFKRIIIISHDIIGRGINLVSRDFEWHLTHMFYRPSINTTVPMMLQSMRLCGRFRDDLTLTLYTEKTALETILRGHQLQREVVERIIRAGRDDKAITTADVLRGETFHPKKIPRRSVFLAKTRRANHFLPTVNAEEDNGWSLEEFQRPIAFEKTMPPPPPAPPVQQPPMEDAEIPPMPANEFHRLTNPVNGMFKRWADPNDRNYTTAIASFMRDGLEPQRRYTKREITELWKQYSRKNRLTVASLLSPYMGNSKGYGQILVESNGEYLLHPQLRTAFETHF